MQTAVAAEEPRPRKLGTFVMNGTGRAELVLTPEQARLFAGDATTEGGTAETLTAAYAAGQAAEVLHQARRYAVDVLDYDQRARVLDTIASTWITLAVSMSENRAMMPPAPADPDDD